jgi:hypothetical protein
MPNNNAAPIKVPGEWGSKVELEVSIDDVRFHYTDPIEAFLDPIEAYLGDEVYTSPLQQWFDEEYAGIAYDQAAAMFLMFGLEDTILTIQYNHYTIGTFHAVVSRP